MTFEFSNEDRNLDVHYFDPKTFEFKLTDIGLLIKAGEGLPGGSTIDPLPTIPAGSVARRLPDNSAWEVVQDNRGDTAYAKDLSNHDDFEIETLDDLPSTHVLTERPSKNHVYNNSTQSWEVDSLKQSQKLQLALNSKLSEIDKAAKTHIETEFNSSALGTLHSYDCLDTDQRNVYLALIESKSLSSSVGYMAKPSGQHFQEVQHTELQLEQVMVDMNAHIRAKRAIARSKKNAAITAHGNGDLLGIESVDANSGW